MKRFLLVGSIVIGIAALAHADPQTWGHTKNGAGVTTNEGTILTSSFTVVGGTATVTVSTPTTVTYTGVGDEYNYITDIHIEMYATATLTGGAAPYTCTTTNMPGNPVFTFPSAAAVGTVTFYNIDYVFPLRSTLVGTQTIITCPGKPNVIWNMNVNSYQDD